MSRHLRHLALLLTPTLLAATITLVVVSLSRPAPATAALPHDLNLQNRYCYSWDFLNNTGYDATGLLIRLQGLRTIDEVYTGTLNPFGAPVPSSGYDAVSDAYTLVFSNGLVFNGDAARLGLCTDQPSLQLDPSTGVSPFAWMSGSQLLSPSPLFIGIDWDWLSRDHLQVHLVNSQNLTLTLFSLNLLSAGVPLPLDDLTVNPVELLPMATQWVTDVEVLTPQASSAFDVFFSPALGNLQPEQALLQAPDYPYVLQATLATADDPGNLIHLYSQATSPPAQVYVPMVMR